ncbi:hypothetical protein BH09PLA1_BH09PLA1_33800 [soil metagenome]
MQGVTTALVAFIFFCVIFPERVKNRPQFYAALGFIALIILLDALAYIIQSTGFRMFSYFAIAGLQIGSILILFMAAGGLSWRDLKDEMGNAYEVIRRGGEEKEIIIPLTGQKPQVRDVDDEVATERIKIDPPSPKPGSNQPGIPLE